MVYDIPDDVKREQAHAKVESQFVRAEHYVSAINAAVVVPSAGPPCFLDDELFHLNMIDGDEISIFPDQAAFRDRLLQYGRTVALAIPGTTIEAIHGEVRITQPDIDMNIDTDAPFCDKRNYLRTYQHDWRDWLAAERASWLQKTSAFQPRLAAWWEPLLLRAPQLRAGVGGLCLLRSGDESVVIDFPAGSVRTYAGETCQFRFDIDPRLLEKVIRDYAVDWSNSLFLSCRFVAWREGAFNEYLYNFFKSLSVERIDRAEAEACRRLGPVSASSEAIQMGDFTVERYCPHRQADLSVFGAIEGDELVCTLHGWRFRTTDGSCVNAADRRLQIRRTR
jgi:UDP-MurNAc hydroxylase